MLWKKHKSLTIQHFKSILYSSGLNYFLLQSSSMFSVFRFYCLFLFYLPLEDLLPIWNLPCGKEWIALLFLLWFPLSHPVILRFYCQISLYIYPVLNKKYICTIGENDSSKREGIRKDVILQILLIAAHLNVVSNC